ncbi:hypothetical protein HPB50_012162 [Hyalomma asiaticum]|uniref:Uncharacterized protein n=1 Tax=Hyalomma asiaticum TaxID=266040 RepID=A0ACB7TGY6_HYAAI|nr:hypothetical protein HPB50_012162 [Hyalomma asiaticum]
MESSRRNVVRGKVERYFFSSWSYEDRLCLRKLYDRDVAKWVYLMQQNEAAGGRRRDDCSQWSLWRSLALKLPSWCNRSVKEKEMEHFFRRVICGVARPEQVSDLLDSLLFPERLSVAAADDANGRSEHEDGAEIQWEVIKVVDAPEPQIAASNASGAREDVGEQAMNERRVLGATGGSQPSECDKKLTAANQSDAVSVFSENDASACVLGDDVAIDVSIVRSESDDEDAVLKHILASARNAQDDGVLECTEGATVANFGDDVTLPLPRDGAGTVLSFSDCTNGDFGAENLIYGSHSEGLHSDAGHMEDKCSTGGPEEDICGSACESPCSVSNRRDAKIQSTPETVDRGVQCDIDSDYLNELMEIEDALNVEVVMLFRRMLEMQDEPTE